MTGSKEYLTRTLVNIAIASMAMASTSALAYVLPTTAWGPCPAPPTSLQQLAGMVTALQASTLDINPDCLSSITAKWDEGVWPVILSMLASQDDAQRSAALRMLEWRPDLATRHADVLPALVAQLASATTPTSHRYRIKPLILAFGERAVVALPLFMAQAAAREADDSRPDVEWFVELSKRTATPLDHLLALIDAGTATMDARMAVASHIGRGIPGSARAVPALKRLIERPRSEPATYEQVSRLAGLIDGYLVSEDTAKAATYLVTLRARDPAGDIASALDRTKPVPGLNAQLVALFDQPALAVAAAATLGGRRRDASPADGALNTAVARLDVMLADAATRPTALDCIRAMARPAPVLGPQVFSYYQTLGKQETAKRQQALRALEVAGGLSEQQLYYLARDVVRELRAGYPARKGHVAAADILRVLAAAETLPAQSVPQLVDAFRLARLPNTPFTPEQTMLVELIGNTRSAAGMDMLVRMFPQRPLAHPAQPAWYLDTDALLRALTHGGDAALPVLERQLQQRDGIELAMVESMLVEMNRPASNALIARHAERVGPALLAALAAGSAEKTQAGRTRRPLEGIQARSISFHCVGFVPESALAVAIFRIGRLQLATTPASLEQVALAIDGGQVDVDRCATGTLLAARDAFMARAALEKVAAMPGRPVTAWALSQLKNRDWE